MQAFTALMELPMLAVIHRPLSLCTALLLACATHASAWASTWPPVPSLSAHRGASALKPEHTQAAFEQAIQDGADILELDVVLSQDGVLVVRHDNALAALNADGSVKFATTNIAQHPEFAARKTTKMVDGASLTGWFTEDFTWAELQSLRATERFAALRPASAALDGQLPLMTLQQVATLIQAHNATAARPAGLFIEIKHAAHAKALGLDMVKAMVDLLNHNQWNHAESPVLVKSFEVQILQDLRAHSAVRIVQLLSNQNGPPDLAAQGVTYAQMGTAQGMANIRQYAQGVSLLRHLAADMDKGQWVRASAVMRAAKDAGLSVHIWTLRPENQFLPNPYKNGSNPAQRGNAQTEAKALLSIGADGLITDDPASIRAAFGR